VCILENSEGSKAQTHGDRLRTEVQRLEAGRMGFRGVQQTIDVNDEASPGPDAWNNRPVCPKLNIRWKETSQG